MNRDEVLSYLTAEIARLTSALDLMMGQDSATPRRPGRPKGSANKAVSFNPEEFTPQKRRTMSPEGKARIVAAQKKRRAAEKSKRSKKTALTPSTLVRKTASTRKKNVPKPAPKPTMKKAAAKKAKTPGQAATTAAE